MDEPWSSSEDEDQVPLVAPTYQLGKRNTAPVPPFRLGAFVDGKVIFGDHSAAEAGGFLDATDHFFYGMPPHIADNPRADSDSDSYSPVQRRRTRKNPVEEGTSYEPETFGLSDSDSYSPVQRRRTRKNPVEEETSYEPDSGTFGLSDSDSGTPVQKWTKTRKSPAPATCIPAKYSGVIHDRADHFAKHLFDNGYVVIPSAYTGDLRSDLEKEFMKMPEFKRHPSFAQNNVQVGYICGATSFTSNPSVFHNATSRKFRQETTAALFPFFKAFKKLLTTEFNKKGKCGNLMLRSNSDRIQVRGIGRAPTPESWHRDLNPTAQQFEVSFGGWENCDPEPQHLSAIKGTHALNEYDIPNKKGFASISSKEIAVYTKKLKAQAEDNDTNGEGKIVIPPKHFILFFGNLVHSVNPTKSKYTSVKQFNGYTLTPFPTSGIPCTKIMGNPDRCKGHRPRPDPTQFDKTNMCTFEELEAKMKANDVMTLMSGQTPPMYPANYMVVWNKQLSIFKKFEKEMLIDGAMKYPIQDEDGRYVTCPETEAERLVRVQTRNKGWANKDAERARKGLPEIQRDLGSPVIPLIKFHRQNQDIMRSMKSLEEMGLLGAHPEYKQSELDMARPRSKMCIYSPTKDREELHEL